MSIDSKDYKAQTIQSYDALAAEIVTGFEDYFESVARPEADHFLSLLDPNGTILDLGCGGGQTSAYFAGRGYAPISADLSCEMLNICKCKGLKNAVRLDLESLPFRHHTLDAVWAHTSLIHIPKTRLADALAAIYQRLKPRGALFIALKEGENEGYIGEPGVERWFAAFQTGEFEAYVPPGLNIVRSSRTQIRQTAFLNYLLIKTSAVADA